MAIWFYSKLMLRLHFALLCTMERDFRPGDRVRFLNDIGEAEVLFVIDANSVQIKDETGFDYPFAKKELLLVGDYASEREAYKQVEPELREIIDRNIDHRAVRKADADFQLRFRNRNATNIRRRGEFMEVDLHLHELVDNESGLDNATKLEIQLSHFERMLKQCEQQRISRLIAIHGVGQGVLRAEIRKLLDQFYPHCTFHDADFNSYGYGATEVRVGRSGSVTG